MKLLYVNSKDTEKEPVYCIGWKVDTIPQEIIDKMILVDDVPPEPAYKVNKSNLLYVNPKTKEMWYEEIDRPMTNEETLQQSINALGQALSLEKIKNIQKDATISQLGKELANVKLEVMKLQGGK